ncbi:MAG: hypothetical protein EA382_16385 [Spirochaetaceae bacterium]|nr:MAG: hypothetical protein EA382_16385 [Spirochaetaceae bacterium]
MRAKVVYFSRSGRCERVAQVLVREIESRGVDVEHVRLEPVRGTSLVGGALLAALRVPSGLAQIPDLSGVNLLALVGPVWAGSMTPAMRSMMDALHDLDDRPVVNVVCGFHACQGVAARMMKELHARGAGIVASRAIGRLVVNDLDQLGELARELCSAALDSTQL